MEDPGKETDSASEDHFVNARHSMVDRDIASRGVNDSNVLESMRNVPRHLFVDEDIRSIAYSDQPLPIAHDQTISQPYIVALMAEAGQIKSTDKVLEVGTGSGYSAAVLGQMAQEVYTVETIEELAQSARSVIDSLGYQNIHVMTANGSVGWPENAPYDAIIVTAGAPGIPPSLVEQLAPGGRLVIPVAAWYLFGENLLRVTKLPDEKYAIEKLTAVAFVPLVGKEGYHA